MVHHGVLLGSRQRLDNIGHCCGHQPAAWGGHATDVQRFISDLAVPEGRRRNKEIEEVLVAVGLEDMNGHFFPQYKSWMKDGRTCCMHRGGQEVHSRTNYILGIYCRLLWNVVVRYAQHNTDHYLVLGCLCGAAPSAHSRYIRKCKCFPIKTPMTPYGIDCLFVDIWGGDSQATLEVTPTPGVRIAGKLASYQHQDYGTPEQGPAEIKGAHLYDQEKPPIGRVLESSQDRLRSGVPPHVQSASYSRGMDPDEKMVQ